MNLKEELVRERSRAQADMVATWIGNDEHRLSDLMLLFMEEGDPLIQRAAWILNIVAVSQPSLLAPHLGSLLDRMEHPFLPSAVKRHVMSILELVPFPEPLHGRIMNAAFGMLEDPAEPIAVRALSMSVLGRLAAIYPDIQAELRLIIEEILAQGAGAGLRARAKKVLQALGKGAR